MEEFIPCVAHPQTSRPNSTQTKRILLQTSTGSNKKHKLNDGKVNQS